MRAEDFFDAAPEEEEIRDDDEDVDDFIEYADGERPVRRQRQVRACRATQWRETLLGHTHTPSPSHLSLSLSPSCLPLFPYITLHRRASPPRWPRPAPMLRRSLAPTRRC